MKNRTKLMVTAATLMLFSSAILPGVALAGTSTPTQTITQKINTDTSVPMKHTTEINGDETIITITDSDMYAYFEAQGISIPKSAMIRGAGVTKIVWHGQARYGNVDLYLSKGWLNTIAAAGIGAVAGALGALLPGAGWGAAIGAISGIIGAQTFSSGKVFKIRSFRYAGMSNQ